MRMIANNNELLPVNMPKGNELPNIAGGGVINYLDNSFNSFLLKLALCAKSFIYRVCFFGELSN